MQATVSDTQVRANLRAVLTRHRIDLSKASFFCARGVVRMLGELRRHGASSATGVELGEIEAIERDIQGLKGVTRVHFDLSNWNKLSNGRWKPVLRDRRRPAPGLERAVAAAG